MDNYYEEEDFQKQIDLSTWKKVLAFARPYRGTMAWIAFFMIGVAAVDIIMPFMTKHAIDEFIANSRTDGLVKFALLYLSIALWQAVNVTIFIWLAGKVETGVSYQIRKAGFDKLQSLSFSYFDQTPVGWIMARMTTDTGKLSEIIAWGLVDIVWGTTLMSGIAVVMLIMNYKLALIVLSVVPLLAWISKKFQVLILASYREVRRTNSKITAAFNEGIMGAVTTKTLVREQSNLQDFKTLTGTMYRSSFRAAVQSALYMPLVQIGAMMGTALAIWYGGNSVIAGDISYGLLVMFLSYAGFFFIPIQEVARIFAEMQNAQASAERVMSLVETPVEITDKDVTSPHPATIKGDISFNNVSFIYKKGQNVLQHFDLEVKAGQTVALVGETGGGKSTIVNLVCRFYEPSSGNLLVDGIDYRQYPLYWYYTNLGVVLQTPHLFSGTVRENIRYGNLKASEEQVIQASELAHAHHFIKELPDQYDTEVTEGGTNFSTGQKQLISLARVILADPRILIMDEATSSVDTETEHLIQQAIELIVQGRTSFIIAHRLSTIRTADRILVISNGQIIEDGTHDSLIRQKGHYHTLYLSQFQEESTRQLLDGTI